MVFAKSTAGHLSQLNPCAGNKRIELGKAGEALALKYLRRHGYKIIEQNYKTRSGEIDIIAKNKDVLAFIEVKTRKSLEYGLPQEAVDIRKQRQISKVALEYLARMNGQEIDCRFDIVAITWLKNQKPQIELLKDAFCSEE
ncbi:MAG: YraN family protein [Nitrospirota bacterium]